MQYTSSSKDIFEKLISIYQKALYESGFKEKLKDTPSDKSFQEENGQRTRSRKIIWFNYGFIFKKRESEHRLELFPLNSKALPSQQ